MTVKRVAPGVLAILLLLALTSSVAGAQGVTGGSQDIGLVTMNAQNGSGESGSATLSQENGKLVVTLNLQNGTAVSQPAHIHKGTCANLDPTPAYPLNNVVNGQSTTTLDVSLGTLMSGTYAINVHKSAAEVTTYVSCGDLTQMARAGGLNPGTTGTPGMPSTGNGDVPLVLAGLALVALMLIVSGKTLAHKAR